MGTVYAFFKTNHLEGTQWKEPLDYEIWKQWACMTQRAWIQYGNLFLIAHEVFKV